MLAIVNTQTFWQRMKDTRFVRLSFMTGKIENDIYLCTNPPEKVEGYLKERLQECIDQLMGESLWTKLTRWLKTRLT